MVVHDRDMLLAEWNKLLDVFLIFVRTCVLNLIQVVIF